MESTRLEINLEMQGINNYENFVKNSLLNTYSRPTTEAELWSPNPKLATIQEPET